MPSATGSKKAKAKRTVCGAKEGFRDSKATSGKSCVDCKCKDQPPKCTLYPYSSNCCKGKDQTPHHVIPKHCFYKGSVEAGDKMPGCGSYNPDRAPCICVTGHDKSETTMQHAKVHNKFDPAEDKHLASKKPRVAGTWTYEGAREAAIDSVVETFPQCSRKCIGAQLDDYHKDTCDIKPDTKLKADSTGGGGTVEIETGAKPGF